VGGTLLIRADADGEIGTGHVMRCLALAQAWQKAGGQVFLLGDVAADAIRRRLRACDIDFLPISRRHPDPADLRATLQLVEQSRDELGSGETIWLAVDGYHFDAQYLEQVRGADARLLVIDDLGRLPPFDADLVLNQNLGAEQTDYPCDEYTTLLLGSPYVLLRQEYLARGCPERKIPELAQNVLVTLGGADPKNVTGMVAAGLAEMDLRDLEVRVVVGAANRHVKSLEQEFGRFPANWRLLKNVDDMPGLVAWADVAVAAAGTTAWELAFSGLPAALLALADHQLPVAERLAAAGAATSLGRADGLTHERIAAELSGLSKDAALRRRQSETGPLLVDGRGASRVVEVMQALDEPIPDERLQLRPAVEEDAKPLWRLANAPSVRKNSLSTDPIAWEEHVPWFRHKLADDTARIWVLDFEGLILGQIRYERAGDGTAETSLLVVATFRRRGLATMLLEETWQQACEELRADRVRAVVRRENVASRLIFVNADFTETGPAEIRGCACDVFERPAE